MLSFSPLNRPDRVIPGEGGTFALFQGLFPKHEADVCDHNGCEYSNTRGRRWLDSMKWPLCIWSLFGTALTLSDGILTPGMLVGARFVFRSLTNPTCPSGLCDERCWGHCRCISAIAPISIVSTDSSNCQRILLISSSLSRDSSSPYSSFNMLGRRESAPSSPPSPSYGLRY